MDSLKSTPGRLTAQPAMTSMAWRPSDILLVEDNADHAMIVKRALTRNWTASTVTWVRDGEEAMAHLKICAQAIPELILLDIKLPRMGGPDLLRNLQANPEWRKIAVIMLTTTDCPEEIRRCYELGARGHVVKGAPPTELLSSLVNLLEPRIEKPEPMEGRSL